MVEYKGFLESVSEGILNVKDWKWGVTAIWVFINIFFMTVGMGLNNYPISSYYPYFICIGIATLIELIIIEYSFMKYNSEDYGEFLWANLHIILNSGIILTIGSIMGFFIMLIYTIIKYIIANYVEVGLELLWFGKGLLIFIGVLVVILVIKYGLFYIGNRWVREK